MGKRGISKRKRGTEEKVRKNKKKTLSDIKKKNGEIGGRGIRQRHFKIKKRERERCR